MAASGPRVEWNHSGNCAPVCPFHATMPRGLPGSAFVGGGEGLGMFIACTPQSTVQRLHASPLDAGLWRAAAGVAVTWEGTASEGNPALPREEALSGREAPGAGRSPPWGRRAQGRSYPKAADGCSTFGLEIICQGRDCFLNGRNLDISWDI